MCFKTHGNRVANVNHAFLSLFPCPVFENHPALLRLMGISTLLFRMQAVPTDESNKSEFTSITEFVITLPFDASNVYM